jgi:hypothetical protein
MDADEAGANRGISTAKYAKYANQAKAIFQKQTKLGQAVIPQEVAVIPEFLDELLGVAHV